MKTQNQSFDGLSSSFFDYLRKLGRSEKTIKMYEWAFSKIKAYVDLNNIQFYDKEAEGKYLESVLGSFSYSQLPNAKKNFINKVETLTEFQQTGTIIMGIKRQPPKTFDGQVGATMMDFMAYRKAIYRLCDVTLKDYNTHLHGLLIFLNKENIDSTDRINMSVILRYIGSIDSSKNPTINRLLLITKNYLRYLYEQKYLPADCSVSIPKGKPVGQRQLPSTFSIEEIKTLLTSVDRSNPKGKRDYAILLLATKLGIRSSDIRGLRFDHILWQQNMIIFSQQKTGKNISLPLLPEIGNAIIDYLQHGRPVSGEHYIFLQTRPPHIQLGRTTIGTMVYYHLGRAGINCTNRKKGPHALRHSFAGALLSKKIPVPVISEALGHSNSESTMNYLRIDAATLGQCALDVPPVPSSFYTQKGGPCHE